LDTIVLAVWSAGFQNLIQWTAEDYSVAVLKLATLFRADYSVSFLNLDRWIYTEQPLLLLTLYGTIAVYFLSSIQNLLQAADS
jgi:hypothetical protein